MLADLTQGRGGGGERERDREGRGGGGGRDKGNVTVFTGEVSLWVFK